jgi:hypothetical protein
VRLHAIGPPAAVRAHDRPAGSRVSGPPLPGSQHGPAGLLRRPASTATLTLTLDAADTGSGTPGGPGTLAGRLRVIASPRETARALDNGCAETRIEGGAAAGAPRDIGPSRIGRGPPDAKAELGSQASEVARPPSLEGRIAPASWTGRL